MTKNTDSAFQKAKAIIPGGVNSPVRAFNGVGGDPVFIARSKGPYIYDCDGKEYLDFVCSWGAIITEHADPDVIAATTEQISKGTTYGAPTTTETELAMLIKDFFPSIDLVRMVNSGTEACMSAIRLARGYTSKEKIIKFDGCYHGHADSFLVKAGSGAATLSISGSNGVNKGVIQDTLICEYNNVKEFESTFEKHKNEIAAVIVEPIVGNAGFIRPSQEFVDSLRKITEKHGAVLIFDEVMTGARVAKHGASEVLGVEADLYTMGKVVGGGFPLAAFGGKRKIMEHIAPLGPVYQAGTLSGNPVAVAAGIAVLKKIKLMDYSKIESKLKDFLSKVKESAKSVGVELQTDASGAMFGISFSATKNKNFSDAKNANIDQYKKFFHECLKKGLYFAPSAYEAGFVSFSHTQEHFDHAHQVIDEIFRKHFH